MYKSLSDTEPLLSAMVPIFVHRCNNPNQHPALICSLSSHFLPASCTQLPYSDVNRDKKINKTIFKNRNSHVQAFSLNRSIYQSQQSSSSVRCWPLRWNATEKKYWETNRSFVFTLALCPESYQESLLQRRLHSSTSALQSLKHRASPSLKPMKLQIGPI